ncbi:hypothetical protein K402DRAFT_389568 [Aulographum hederae CBS 113979]|uniref:Lysine decarboxylase-like protein-like protein n=1 Tax=Aulographum hederae CBS 113979 TaxID=1176131 RepID=A0A6G1HCA5_9PEZI|nr:hypothetical protein K402DRAFT_389568 [Aulographum hederae CBS 113979]
MANKVAELSQGPEVRTSSPWTDMPEDQKQPGTAGKAAAGAKGEKRPVVCVFCGASAGNTPAHLEGARRLAFILHNHGISLVYGGGTVGLMGELARSLVALSGPDAVHGIIPAALVKYEQGSDPNQSDIKKLIDEEIYGRTTVVKDMHTRKHMMAKEVIEGGPGGGFVALSGGYGTLEELMEVTTWNQLGIHNKPVVVFNVEGYYDGLMLWVKGAVEKGFISDKNQGILVEAKTAEEVYQRLLDYKNSEGRFKLEWDSQ